MKIQLYSDLHLEFQRFNVADHVVGDVLVLAGDIAPLHTHTFELNNFLDACTFNFEKVIYVPGNHEYYHGDYQEVNDDLMDLNSKFTNLSVLINGDQIKYKDINFIGGTLWSDLSNPMEELVVTSHMNDFHIISNGYGYGSYRKVKFSGKDSTAIYKVTRDKIFDQLMEVDKTDKLNKTVVVTHHAPSYQSVHVRFDGDPCNPGYCSNLDNHVALVPPKYWLHGHVHNTMNYMIESCNVRTNPRGYNRENRDFDAKFVLEV